MKQTFLFLFGLTFFGGMLMTTPVQAQTCSASGYSGICKASCSSGEYSGGMTHECSFDGSLQCCYSRCGDLRCASGEEVSCPSDCAPEGNPGGGGTSCSGVYSVTGESATGICRSGNCSGGYEYVGDCQDGKICCAVSDGSPGNPVPPGNSIPPGNPGGAGGVGSGGGWDVSMYASYGLPENSISGLIEGLLRWLLYILGFLSVIAFVISGMLFLTSGGNDKQIETAKRYMVWSIVGVIVALSGLIILTAVYWWLLGYTRF